MFHQTFNKPNSYHSIRATVCACKPVIFLFLTERNAWEIHCVNSMPHNLPLFPVYFVVSSQPILAAKYCADCKSKLVQIALVGLVIHPQNSQRDNFTHEPPCFHTNSFGVAISVKLSLTSGLSQKFASTPPSSLMIPALGLVQRSMARKTLINRQRTKSFELVYSLI